MVNQPDKPVPKPTALTQVVQDAICKALTMGMPLKDAAAAGGVSYESLHRWLKQGEETPDTPQGQLLHATKRADADFVDDCLTTLGAAHRGKLKDLKRDWHAAAWLLERRRPSDFSQRQEQHITVTQEEGVPNFKVTARRHAVPSVELDTNGSTNGEAN